MDPARLALLQHLESALAAFGPDVPIEVPAPAPGRGATERSATGPTTQGPAPQGLAAKPSAPVHATTSPRPQPAASKLVLLASPEVAPEPPAPRRASAPPPLRLVSTNSAATPAAPAARATEATANAAASAPIATGATADPIETLRAETFACRKCKLCENRKTVVFGEGNPRPDVLFVGEAPGAVEDQTGRPFVGPAGQLLDKILQGAMGLSRADVYIANVNKCRPPGNRAPEPDEVAACLPFLKRQVELLAPKVIVALGRVAAHNLLGRTEAMRDLRGRDLDYCGIPVVVTWHPAFLLRDPSHKRETWEDIKRVNRLLGRPEVPGS